MSGLAHATIERLRLVSTATLTTQLFKRGLRNAFMQGVRPLGRYDGNLVGPAFTLRNIPAREDLDSVAVFGNPEHPQRKAIEITPGGTCAGDRLPRRYARRLRGPDPGHAADEAGCRRAGRRRRHPRRGADRRDGAISGVLRRPERAAEPRPASRGGEQRADRLRRRRGVSRRHHRRRPRRCGC